MNTQALEVLFELRWLIAIAAAVLIAIWIVQNERTKRIALLCAVIGNVEELPALQASIDRVTSSKDSEIASRRQGFWLVALAEAFGKLPDGLLDAIKVFSFFIGIAMIVLAMGAVHVMQISQPISQTKSQRLEAKQAVPGVAAKTIALVKISATTGVLEEGGAVATPSPDGENVGTGRFTGLAVDSRLSCNGGVIDKSNHSFMEIGL